MAQPSLPSYDSTRNNFLILPILHLPVIELIYKSQAQRPPCRMTIESQ